MIGKQRDAVKFASALYTLGSGSLHSRIMSLSLSTDDPSILKSRALHCRLICALHSVDSRVLYGRLVEQCVARIDFNPERLLAQGDTLDPEFARGLEDHIALALHGRN